MKQVAHKFRTFGTTVYHAQKSIDSLLREVNKFLSSHVIHSIVATVAEGSSGGMLSEDVPGVVVYVVEFSPFPEEERSDEAEG